MNDTDKWNAYHRLMKHKKFFICLPFLTMFLGMTILNLPIYILIIIFAIQGYLSTFIFLTKNICPWCGLPFFAFGKYGLSWNGIKIIFQKKCINCRKPDI